ncbi:benenodin family lasso peptide [Stenotrophomonas nitritireducens]
MNSNDNNRDNADDVIVLGVASVETQGGAGPGEPTGPGLPMIPGISEE